MAPPDPPALDHALASIRVNADPLGDTITAILDWSQPAPAPAAAATAAGLSLSQGVQIHSPAIAGVPHIRGGQRFARQPDREHQERDCAVMASRERDFEVVAQRRVRHRAWLSDAQADIAAGLLLRSFEIHNDGHAPADGVDH